MYVDQQDVVQRLGLGTRSDGSWSLNSSTVTAGTYYVEGDARVSGSPGSTKSPAQISIIAEGSIQISGSPKLDTGYPARLLFVTDEDLKITGTIDVVGEAALVQGQDACQGVRQRSSATRRSTGSCSWKT